MTTLLLVFLSLCPSIVAGEPRHDFTRDQCRTLVAEHPALRPPEEGHIPVIVEPEAWIHASAEGMPGIATPSTRLEAPRSQGWLLVDTQLAAYARVQADRLDAGGDTGDTAILRNRRALFDALEHQRAQAAVLRTRLTKRSASITDPRQRAALSDDLRLVDSYATALGTAMGLLLHPEDGDEDEVIQAVTEAEAPMPALLERHMRLWLDPEGGEAAPRLGRVELDNCLARKLDIGVRVMGRYEGSPAKDYEVPLGARDQAELELPEQALGEGPAEVYLVAPRGQLHPVVARVGDELRLRLVVSR